MSANPNSGINRVKRNLTDRWSNEDYPGGKPRFRWELLSKDIAIFILLPVIAIIFYQSIDCSSKPTNHPNPNHNNQQRDQLHCKSSRFHAFSIF